MVSEDDAFVYRGKINGAHDKILAEVDRLAKALKASHLKTEQVRARAYELISVINEVPRESNVAWTIVDEAVKAFEAGR